MAQDAIDKRTRVLVVEDIAELRDSYVLNLELEQRYRVDGAADLVAATEAITNCTYHVALVDIMLAGEKDVANRDGIKVLERIRGLNEGTRPVVLSIQPHRQLIRDLLIEYDAYDYLDKDAVRAAGFPMIVETINRATEASLVGGVPTWDAAVQSLTAGERGEGQLVSDAMGRLQFKGGFENLRGTLLMALRYFMPLLPARAEPRGLLFDSASGDFRGHFWSKGQRCAIDIVLSAGQRADGSGSSDPPSGALFAREKGGLVIRVEEVPAARADFVATTAAGSDASPH